MKVLMLSSDSSILDQNSAAHARMREYASVCEALHIIVITTKKSPELRVGNLHIVSTNSWFKLKTLYDAKRFGVILCASQKLTTRDSIITVQDPFEIGMIGKALADIVGLKLHVQVHTDFLAKEFIEESFKNKLRSAHACALLKKADRVRVVSKRIYNSILKLQVPAEKISILPIWVDVEKIKNVQVPVQNDLHYKYREFKFIALMVSRLTIEKNMYAVCNAYTKLRKQYPEFGLVIVGDGPEREPMQAAYPFIKFEGEVADPTPYFKTADIFINTSNYEGYGRTLVEAAAAGTPIITTDVGVAREVIEDNKTGIIIPVGDNGAVWQALDDVLSGRIKLTSPTVATISKTEYLGQYKADWEACLV